MKKVKQSFENLHINNMGGIIMNGKKSFFTLIELLIVVAIIAILAGMLLPALNQARGMAQKSACSANLKQISLGLLTYAGDHHEFFPPWRRLVTGDEYSHYYDVLGKSYLGIETWKTHFTVAHYTKNLPAGGYARNMLLCPNLVNSHYGTNYMINHTFSGDSGSPANFVSLKRVTKPSGSGMLLETGMKTKDTRHTAGSQSMSLSTPCRFSTNNDITPWSATSGYTGNVVFPHSRVMNAALMDGHVGVFRFERYNKRVQIESQDPDGYTRYKLYR